MAIPTGHKFSNRDGIFLEELNGEKILLYSKIGFWYDLCREKAPNAKFLLQNERETFTELAEFSSLLSFTTSILIENNYSPKNCVYKPILDAEANVNYYCACKPNQKNRFKNLFAELSAGNSERGKVNYFF